MEEPPDAADSSLLRSISTAQAGLNESGLISAGPASRVQIQATLTKARGPLKAFQGKDGPTDPAQSLTSSLGLLLQGLSALYGKALLDLDVVKRKTLSQHFLSATIRNSSMRDKVMFFLKQPDVWHQVLDNAWALIEEAMEVNVESKDASTSSDTATFGTELKNDETLSHSSSSKKRSAPSDEASESKRPLAPSERHEVPRCEVCDKPTYTLECKKCKLRICSPCRSSGCVCMCGWVDKGDDG